MCAGQNGEVFLLITMVRFLYSTPEPAWVGFGSFVRKIWDDMVDGLMNG
jgi:hypothetical protein